MHNKNQINIGSQKLYEFFDKTRASIIHIPTHTKISSSVDKTQERALLIQC